MYKFGIRTNFDSTGILNTDPDTSLKFFVKCFDEYKYDDVFTYRGNANLVFIYVNG